MIAPRLLPPTRVLPNIRWRAVADTETRIAFAHITSMSFEIPFNTTGKKWVRFAAWDVAGNGALEQPIKLNQPPTTTTK